MDEFGARKLICSIVLQAVKDVNRLYKKVSEVKHFEAYVFDVEELRVLNFFDPNNSWGSTILSFQGLDVLPKEFQRKLDYLNEIKQRSAS